MTMPEQNIKSEGQLGSVPQLEAECKGQVIAEHLVVQQNIYIRNHQEKTGVKALRTYLPNMGPERISLSCLVSEERTTLPDESPIGPRGPVIHPRLSPAIRCKGAINKGEETPPLDAATNHPRMRADIEAIFRTLKEAETTTNLGIPDPAPGGPHDSVAPPYDDIETQMTSISLINDPRILCTPIELDGWTARKEPTHKKVHDDQVMSCSPPPMSMAGELEEACGSDKGKTPYMTHSPKKIPSGADPPRPHKRLVG